jgi:hypothetical protein
MSLVARPVNAWAARKARDPELIMAAADHLLGTEHPKVYLGAWEFYYAGRASGWEMFVPYGRFSTDESTRLNQTLDAAIVYTKDPATVTDPLVAAGLQRSREIHIGASTSIDNASLRGGGFGTYVLYARAANR